MNQYKDFVPLIPERLGFITFNVLYNRFYIPKRVFEYERISARSRVGLSYNHKTNQLLLDKEGNGFKIDANRYITSLEFSRELLKHGDKYKNKTIKYVRNDELSNDRFVVFDEQTINDIPNNN